MQFEAIEKSREYSGGLATAFNVVNMIVYMSERELRRKYIYFMCLDFGQMVNGISYIMTGVGRGLMLLEGTLATHITVHDCFFTVGLLKCFELMLKGD